MSEFDRAVFDTGTPHIARVYDYWLGGKDNYAADRDAALERARKAVAAFAIAGPKTNLAFHAELLVNPEFVSGDYDTSLITRMRPDNRSGRG